MIPPLLPISRRLAALFTALSLVVQAHGAFKAYLFLPGIPGESHDAGRTNWIDILTLDQSPAASPVAGRAHFSDLRLAKCVDRTSPVLMQNCALGKPVASARLQIVNLDEGQSAVLELGLTNVIVTGIAPSFDRNFTNAAPSETISLNFGSVSWAYTLLDSWGKPIATVQAFWDMTRNAGGSRLSQIFRISGIQKTGNNVTVSWYGLAGKTYHLYSSQVAQGPYAVIAQTTVSSDGPTSLMVNGAGPVQFYRMDQTP